MGEPGRPNLGGSAWKMLLGESLGLQNEGVKACRVFRKARPARFQFLFVVAQFFPRKMLFESLPANVPPAAHFLLVDHTVCRQ